MLSDISMSCLSHFQINVYIYKQKTERIQFFPEIKIDTIDIIDYTALFTVYTCILLSYYSHSA